jgi:hypothetical protein
MRVLLLACCLALCVFGVTAYPSMLASHKDERVLLAAEVVGAGTPAGAPGTVQMVKVPQLNLTDAQLMAMVRKKTVCPFIGAAVVSRQLPVFGSVENPWTRATDIRDTANTGGGDFGDLLYNIGLVNLPGAKAPAAPAWALGYSPLALAGSIAAHAGHSGILSGPSDVPNAGRFSQEQWDRLMLRNEGGYITRTNLAKWCAESNLMDKTAKPVGLARILNDIEYFLKTFAGSMFARHARIESGSKLLTAKELDPLRAGVMAALASNLFNSAAEMAFLATVLHHSPKTRQAYRDVEFAVSVEDLKSLYIDRRLPKGYTTWPKNKSDFSAHVGPCVKEAAQHYLGGKLKGYTVGK